ncbi:MAG TPA: hypothetical protein VHB25_20635 [Gemmatimonadaceae bacterium]|nr:hypothetical protein [Gemmatimonadaceae bacterium]
MPSSVHFRRSSWGDSPARVRSVEPGEPAESDGDLIYSTTLVGYPALLFYKFANDELCEGTYVIDNSDDAADVDAYFKLQEMLTGKYGEPANKEANWRDPYRAPDVKTYAQAAKAVATGELTLRSVWFTPDSRVLLVCAEDRERYNAIVFLFYEDLRRLQAGTDVRHESDLDLL